MMLRPLYLRLLPVLALTLFVAGCGKSDNDVPPTVTRVATSLTATVVEEPTTSGTLAANEITAGAIADRIAAAWPAVRQYTSVTVILPASGTPVASPEVELTGRAERDVVLPGTKRIAITDQGATTEIVLVNGVLSKRTIAGNSTAGAWTVVDPATVAATDPFAQTYNTILAPETPPYSGLSDRQRERIGTQQGQSTINGRACTDYLFPEVSDTGEQIQIVISLDAQDLPCRIATTAGTSISQTDYTFNGDVTFATPVR